MIKIIKIFDIEIKVNYSLIPIIILGIFFGFLWEIVVLFTIVTLHEFAHGAVSNLYGYEAKSIELFAFGGVVKSEDIIFLKPSQVIIISLAGPLLNFFLLLSGLLVRNIFDLQLDILNFFINSNLSLGIFNLLPIIPLDGGRILRAYLNTYMDIKKATYTSVNIGKVLCIIIFVIGIILTIESLRGIMLIVFSLYLYVMSKNENEIISLQHMQKIFTKPTVNKKVNVKVKYISVYEQDSLKDVLKVLSVGTYCIVKVLDSRGRLLGELTEGEILEAVIMYDSLTTLENLITIKKKKKRKATKDNKG